jgi:hypothetical protein
VKPRHLLHDNGVRHAKVKRHLGLTHPAGYVAGVRHRLLHRHGLQGGWQIAPSLWLILLRQRGAEGRNDAFRAICLPSTVVAPSNLVQCLQRLLGGGS